MAERPRIAGLGIESVEPWRAVTPTPIEDFVVVRHLQAEEPEARPLLRVFNRRPRMKLWPIPAREERRVQLRGKWYKFCDHCHLPKPTSEFRSDRTQDDGAYGTCSQCESGRRRYNRMVDEGVIPPQPNVQWGEQYPTIVCLCGSTRFWKTFQEENLRLTLEGKIVLSVGAATKSDAEHFGHLTEAEMQGIKDNLDELHKRKIDLADEVLVLNVGGYIGTSTASEIQYAWGLGKPVYFLEAPL